MSSFENFQKSEMTLTKSTFLRHHTHKDDNMENPTKVTFTNSGSVFDGPLGLLRNHNKQHVDYGSGYVAIQTTRPRSSNAAAGKDSTFNWQGSWQDRQGGAGPKAEFEAAAIIDMDNFLNVFGDPEPFSKYLLGKANEVVKEWNATNGSKDKVGKRNPVQKIFTVAEYSWMGDKGRRESSCYDLQLNTYGYTLAVRDELKPVMRLKDVRVALKMRSSAMKRMGADTSAAIDGKRYDGYGYAAPCTHFIALLRSEGFRKLVEEGKEHRRGFAGAASAKPALAKSPRGTKRRAVESSEAVVSVESLTGASRPDSGPVSAEESGDE